MKGWLAGACLVAAASAYGFQAAAPAAAAKGSIEGQVVNGMTGAPLKKVNVRLTTIPDRPANGGRGPAVAAGGRGQGSGGAQPMAMPMGPGGMRSNIITKETDETGRFSFTGLEAARYQLSAERTGFLRQNYGARRYSSGGTPIRLGQDQQVRDVLMKMSPQAVLAGRVLDEDGEPAANVNVRAFKYQYRSGKKQWTEVNSGQTSDIGEFRIPNLEPGKYLIATRSRNPNNGPPQMMVSNQPLPDTPETMYASTYYPSTTDAANAVPVEVGAGGEMRGIDIRLVKTQVFRIRGRVLGAPAPTEGRGGRGMVMVGLATREGRQTAGMSPARPPENTFEIRGVVPGSYLLFTQGGGPNAPVGYMPVEVGNRHVDGVTLTVGTGMDVGGSIKIEGASGETQASNLSVNLRPTLLQMGPAPRARAAAEGTFTLKNVAPLKYAVNVSGLPEGCYVKSVRYAGQEVPDDGLDFLSSAPIEITLSATAADLSATIVDGDGKTVSNSLVAIVPKDGPASSVQSRNTDENGAASFRNLKPGEYRVFAWEDLEPGAYQDPDVQKKFEARATTVKLEPSAKAAVQVKVIPAE